MAVNLRRHGNLIAWARERDLFVRVDRATPWGNPFVTGRDGDRATVIARFRDDHLPARPDLLARLDELRGRALDSDLETPSSASERVGSCDWPPS